MKELKKILLVDDEKSIQMLAKMVLEKIGGFEVDIFSSGLEALESISENKIPDLILLDVVMPEMDGTEVIKRIKSHYLLTKTPVFFLTGKNSESEIQNLLKLGACEVISKPFDPQLLSEEIRNKFNKIYEL